MSTSAALAASPPRLPGPLFSPPSFPHEERQRGCRLPAGGPLFFGEIRAAITSSSCSCGLSCAEARPRSRGEKKRPRNPELRRQGGWRTKTSKSRTFLFLSGWSASAIKAFAWPLCYGSIHGTPRATGHLPL